MNPTVKESGLRVLNNEEISGVSGGFLVVVPPIVVAVVATIAVINTAYDFGGGVYEGFTQERRK